MYESIILLGWILQWMYCPEDNFTSIFQINEVKSKAEITSEEYNQLLLEHTKLDKRSSILGKKDD